jgi:hypothetical protein
MDTLYTVVVCFVLPVLWLLIGPARPPPPFYSVAVLTKDGGIAATVAGSSCKPQDLYLDGISNCTVVVVTEVNDTYTSDNQECIDLFRKDIPGSNLYFCVWGSLLAAVNITLRWKAAQALQFAQTAQRQGAESTEGKEEGEDDDDAI